MKKQPRIIFAGTPEFAAVYLEQLIKQGFSPEAVYTQPDRGSGRGKKITQSAVKQLALENNIPVYQPINFKQASDREQLQQLKPDLLIVVAYGLLLPQAVLDIPRLGCINAHASLLPKWRGAAPIQRAIEAGDKNSGVCLMQMERGLDTGAVFATVKVPIGKVTAAELHDILAQKGAELLIQNLPQILNDELAVVAQDDSKTCYAHKLSKQDAEINWSRSADILERQIRAFNSWPVSYFKYKDKVIRVWRADVITEIDIDLEPGTIIKASTSGIEVATGGNVLNITQLQMPGKKAISIEQLLLGQANFFEVGSKLL